MTNKANIKSSRDKAPPKTWDTNPLVHCRRIMLRFLQGLFGQAPKGHFRWESDSKASEIFITDNFPVSVDETGAKPCISCARSPVQFGGLFLNDFQQYHVNNGETVTSDLISGSMILNCCSRHSVEAEYIGWICARHIWVFRKHLIRQGFHEVGRNIQVSPAMPAEGVISGNNVEEWKRVSVVSPFFFRYSDKMAPTQFEIFNHMDITANIKYPSVKKDEPIGVSLVGTGLVARTEDNEES